MKIGKYEFPEDRYYDRDHNWALVQEDGLVVQGLSDFAQDIAGEILYTEPPRQGRDLEQGKPFMSMESGKWVGRIKAVVSGKVAESNSELEWESALINKDPYGRGWLVKIRPSNLEAELANLMKPTSPEFADFMKAEMAKYGK